MILQSKRMLRNERREMIQRTSSTESAIHEEVPLPCISSGSKTDFRNQLSQDARDGSSLVVKAKASLAADSAYCGVQKRKSPIVTNQGSRPPKKSRRSVSARSVSANDSPMPPHSSLRTLASPEDCTNLNPLHIFVRQQIEVFMATAADLAEPAPGRKKPIQLNQVGLRCIHCRHITPRERVKRATCYPSSVGRIYNAVSDMKFDHFSGCKGLPQKLRDKFVSLKERSARLGDRHRGRRSCCLPSTAQYYHDSAIQMGMTDRGGGIFMDRRADKNVHLPAPLLPRLDLGTFDRHLSAKPLCSLEQSIPVLQAHLADSIGLLSRNSFSNLLSRSLLQAGKQSTTITCQSAKNVTTSTSATILATSMDKDYLNALHCFVRSNVEVFVASMEDIDAPSPGRKKPVILGQVGLRCIHCAKLSVKDRTKRAVCYPPSINGIYHSVSNMKFDHFGSCRGLPPAAREEFQKLREACRHRSGNTSNGSRGMANSTAQYYHDSALRLGLVDTPRGIRFGYGGRSIEVRDSSIQGTDGISALMLAATKQRIPVTDDQRETLASEHVCV